MSSKTANCGEINNLFCNIFQLLQPHETDNKFHQLTDVFRTLLLTDNLLSKIVQDLAQMDKNNLQNLIYFKNTQFQQIYDEKLTPAEQQQIYDNFTKIHRIASEKIKPENPSAIPPGLENILQSDYVQKMLASMGSSMGANGQDQDIMAAFTDFMKKNQSQLEHVQKLMNQFMSNNSKAPDLGHMQEMAMNFFKNDSMFKSIAGLWTSSIGPKLMENLHNNNNNQETATEEDNENSYNFMEIFQKIRERIRTEHPDISTQIDTLSTICTPQNFTQILDTLQSKMDDLDLTDFDSIMNFFKQHIEQDETMQSVLSKFYAVFESGLINLQNLRPNCMKILQIALEEFNLSHIISASDYETLKNLLMFRKFGFRKKKLSKNKRKERRIKQYRRKKRQEYKQQHKHHQQSKK